MRDSKRREAVTHAKRKGSRFGTMFCTGRTVSVLLWGKPEKVTCKACLARMEREGIEGIEL